MRDEKEERKKQARSNKQTRQSNTAHVHVTVQYTCIYMLQYNTYVFICYSTVHMYALSDGRYILNTIYMYMYICYSTHVFTCSTVHMYALSDGWYMYIHVHVLNTIYMYMYMYICYSTHVCYTCSTVHMYALSDGRYRQCTTYFLHFD